MKHLLSLLVILASLGGFLAISLPASRVDVAVLRDSLPCDDRVATNPDLTGIGIRLASYTQAFFLVLAPVFLENSRALSNIFSNALLSAVSLMAVTLVNVKRTAFIDGIAVTFLESIMIFTAFIQVEILVALRDKVIWGLYLLAILLRTLLEIIYWGNPDTPSPLTCTSGTESQRSTAAQKARYTAIAFLAIILLFAVPLSISTQFRGPRRARNPWRIALIPIACIAISLQIIVVEVIIGTDGSISDQANSWTHGQILSLLLVCSNILDFISALNSPHRDFHLFSWRGMHFDYQVCKIRLAKKAKNFSDKALRRSSQKARSDVPMQISVAPEILPPPIRLTPDHVDDYRTSQRPRHIIFWDETSAVNTHGRPGPINEPPPVEQGVIHKNRLGGRPGPLTMQTSESLRNIHFPTISGSRETLHSDESTSAPPRPRRWST